ncbi:MAG: peptidase S41, partial [Maribacter sp.]|nr:peptidase S41 [Maribacter sp.]
PKGRVVYGGGGIIPDVFVPIGSNEEEAIKAIDSRGWFSFFSFEHLDADRQRYNDILPEEFTRNFIVDDILFEQFVDYLISRNLKMDYYDFEDLIKLNIKAALAEQLYGANVHAKIKSSADTMLKQVLELDRPLIQQGKAEAIEAKN